MNILVGIGVVLGLLVIFGMIGFMFLRREISKMKTVETQEVIENIYAVQDSQVNFYLIKSGDQYLAIDAGNNVDQVQQQFENLNINPLDVTIVLLTHTDSDHVAALDLFKNATIYISEAEEQMIDGRTARFMSNHNALVYDYELFADEQVIELLGVKVKGILTPGHTMGSMSYIINNKYLFTGDTLGLDNGKVYKIDGLLRSFYYMDTAAQQESLQKLANLNGIEYIFTGHYGFTNDYATAFTNWDQ